jgi:caffeoyl-CoA O-methyltransferase
MFHDIPQPMLERMKEMEARDVIDRQDGTPIERRLRQVVPTTGRLIALLAAMAPPGALIEIGTSAGYSSLWLSLACRATGRRLTTFELLPSKAEWARETFRLSGVEDLIDVVVGDARDYLPGLREVAFCFLDAEKDIYLDCYEMVVPNLVRGGLLVADNTISHAEPVQPMIDRALNDPRVDALNVAVDKGVLVCRKI